MRAQLLFAGHHVRLERVGGLPRIVITDLETGEAHTVAFEEEAYDLSLLPGYEFETETLRFVYSSVTTPAQTFDYDMRTPRPDPAQDRRRCRAGTTHRRLRHPQAHRREP